MRMVKEKDGKFKADSYIPELHPEEIDQDISMVYKPGKEKDFRVLPSRTNGKAVSGDRFGGVIVGVIIAWIFILGGLSLAGMEINQPEIFLSLVASFVISLSFNYLYHVYKKS